MKKTIFIFFLLIIISVDSFSQSIRKSFTELTTSEKSELQNAIYQMRDVNGDGIISDDINFPDSDDLITDLANFHGDNFNFNGSGHDDLTNDNDLDIHYNLPNQNDIQIFFGWHRYQMFELEQALQNVNPKISLAYWNSSVDRDLNTLSTTLFGPDLLGPFQTDWGLGRDFNGSGYQLPTPAEVTSVKSYTDFTADVYNSFSNRTERESPHVGAHAWTGGAMISHYSPTDPVFYFHHSWVDKIWTEWEEVHPGQSTFQIQSMIRYDGTYPFNGQILPLINPNNITNTRTLGVFYAESGLAELDDYTVTNTHNPIENFYYQFTIEAGNNFIIPNSKFCEIESVNMIILEPGFTAETGATFTAKIDTDNNINTTSRADLAQNQDRYNPIDFGGPFVNVYEIDSQYKPEKSYNLKLFPNPFKSRLTLTLDKKLELFKIELFDLTGKQVFSKNYSDTNKVDLNDLDFLSTGNYILKVSTKDDIILNTKILKI